MTQTTIQKPLTQATHNQIGTGVPPAICAALAAAGYIVAPAILRGGALVPLAIRRNGVRSW